MNVLIVGAGPAGSTAAYYLAKAGIDVTVLEKTSFPREKVCGDGLTPRAVREIQKLGLAHPETDGWRRNKGLRLIAGGRTIELPWPEVADFPQYGLIRTRLGFDEQLARHAQSAGAVVLERHSVTEALRSEDGRVTGVRAALLDNSGRKTGETRDFSADVVLAADGNSTRTAVSLGIGKRDDRPLGVAVRTYFTSPRHDDDWMEGWLELPGRDGKLLPGYGWVFGVGDGTSNVGLGILNSSKDFGKLDYKQVLREWTAGMPADWGFTPDNQVGEIRGAALPMGFNRTPHYSPGPAAPRRRRRHGLPVQRRGHLLRHGVRPLRGRIHRRRRCPFRVRRLERRPTPTRTLPGTPTTCASSGAHTSHWDGRSPP